MNECRCTRCHTTEEIPTYQSLILYGNGNKNAERYDLCKNCWENARRRINVFYLLQAIGQKKMNQHI